MNAGRIETARVSIATIVTPKTGIGKVRESTECMPMWLIGSEQRGEELGEKQKFAKRPEKFAPVGQNPQADRDVPNAPLSQKRQLRQDR